MSQINKTVTIVAYPPDEYADEREWADEYDDEEDYYAQVEREDTRYFLKHPTLGFKKEIDSEEFERMSRVNTGELRTEKVVEVDNPYSNNPRTAFKKMVNEILDNEATPEDAGFSSDWWGVTYVNEDTDEKVKVYPKTDMIPLLKMPNQFDPDDKFVDDHERVALKAKVRITVNNEDTDNLVSDHILQPLYEHLGKHEGIERVRMLDCERKTVEKYVCHNI